MTNQKLIFKNVIVRTPSAALSNGITSNPTAGKPDYKKALIQHAQYIEILKGCGVNVTVLPALENYPDSCFVEDTAVLTPKVAIIANPGAVTRNGEKNEILSTIKKFFPEDKIKFIKAPGTLDGGDVMMVGNTFYIGKSERTNDEGIRQIIEILESYGHKGIEVTLTEVLHLKTGVNYIENNTLLVYGEFIDNPLFKDFKKIIIPNDEAYSANCIYVNGTVIVPSRYPKVEQLIRDAGYKVVTTDTYEYYKVDGGLSCLSLRFTSLL